MSFLLWLYIKVAILDGFFSDGAAYCMGSLNKDCWYIYTLNPLDRLGHHKQIWWLTKHHCCSLYHRSNPLTPFNIWETGLCTQEADKKMLMLIPTHLGTSKKHVDIDVESTFLIRYIGDSEADQTIEILMSELDPAVMDIFYRHLFLTFLPTFVAIESFLEFLWQWFYVKKVNVIELSLNCSCHTLHICRAFFHNPHSAEFEHHFVKISVNSHLCGFLCSQSLDLICSGSAQKMEEMRQRYTYYQFQFSIVKGRQTDIRVNSLQKSGIDKLLPHMKIDDYLFNPCGYSMNGVLQNVRR